MSAALLNLFAEVHAERERQDAKFPGQVLPDGTGGPHRDLAEVEAKARCNGRHADGKLAWAEVLEEEVAEALAAPANSTSLRKELIQVAAVCLRWVEGIDARTQECTACDYRHPIGKPCCFGAGGG